MRKHTSFAVAAMILGLSTMFWVRSSVVATGADVARAKAHANYVVAPSPYLPLQIMEPVY